MTVEKNKASEYTLNSDDVKAIINNTDTTRDKLIIELLAFTGCRRQELVLLRIKDINLELEQINMPTVKQEKQMTKDKRGKQIDAPKVTKLQRIQIAYNHNRRIPIINDDLKRDLKTHIENLSKTRNATSTSRLIQSRQSNAITTAMINIIVSKSAELANVKSPNPDRRHVHPHQFRHTFVRYAIKYGLNFKVIQKMVGHTNMATTFSMYGEPSWQDKKDELAKMKEFGR